MVPPFSALAMPASYVLRNPVGFLPFIRERMETWLSSCSAHGSKLLLIIERAFGQEPVGDVKDLLG